MNKKGMIILLLIILGVVGFKFILQNKATQGELVPVANAETALSDALINGKPTFLEFTSDSCPACRTAKPWIEEFYQTYNEEVNFIIANVDNGGLSLAHQLGIKVVPTFVYYDKTGIVAEALEGYPATNSKEYLEDKIKALLE